MAKPMTKAEVARILNRIDNYQVKIHDLYYKLKEAGQDIICEELDDNCVGALIVDTSSMITGYKAGDDI